MHISHPQRAVCHSFQGRKICMLVSWMHNVQTTCTAYLWGTSSRESCCHRSRPNCHRSRSNCHRSRSNCHFPLSGWRWVRPSGYFAVRDTPAHRPSQLSPVPVMTDMFVGPCPALICFLGPGVAPLTTYLAAILR